MGDQSKVDDRGVKPYKRRRTGGAASKTQKSKPPLGCCGKDTAGDVVYWSRDDETPLEVTYPWNEKVD